MRAFLEKKTEFFVKKILHMSWLLEIDTSYRGNVEFFEITLKMRTSPHIETILRRIKLEICLIITMNMSWSVDIETSCTGNVEFF